jgi:hypothetical protein
MVVTGKKHRDNKSHVVIAGLDRQSMLPDRRALTAQHPALRFRMGLRPSG